MGHHGCKGEDDDVADSRTTAKAPLRILCQSATGSCAACCGAFNFRDRSDDAMQRRLRRRTSLVTAAWPDVDALAAVRDRLLAEEAPEVLFAAVKVCPFAGHVDVGGDRVGCLLHPTRHPEGADLRDLAVYPKEVCAGHFCASHDWLRPREADLAQTAVGLLYGRVVTDASLVKAVGRALDDVLGRSWVAMELPVASDPLLRLWRLLLQEWPFVDDDPRRFGGFFFDGDDAIERSLPSAFFGATVTVTAPERIIVDAIGTRPLNDDDATAALGLLRGGLSRVADRMESAR